MSTTGIPVKLDHPNIPFGVPLPGDLVYFARASTGLGFKNYVGSLGVAGTLFLESIVDTAADIEIDFLASIKAFLRGSENIDADADINFTNETSTLEFDFAFTIENFAKLTLPSNCFMADARWELDGAKIWTPGENGEYIMHGRRFGTSWRIDISNSIYV